MSTFFLKVKNVVVHFNLSLNFYRRTTITIKIPSEADFAHYNAKSKNIVYYIDGVKKTIGLPKHVYARRINLTPMYNLVTLIHNKERYIEIEMLK